MKKLRLKDRLIAAVDAGRRADLMKILAGIGNKISTVKLGLEIIYGAGTGAVDIARRSGYEVMLDAKLMDIPNTIAGASSAIARLRPSMVTIHVLGGKKMIQDAQDALRAQSENQLMIKPLLMGVTVLTSLDDGDLETMGFKGGYMDTVKRLAGIALEAGVDGIICSPNEAAHLRREFGSGFYLATPGIRLAKDGAGDQKRVNTPEEAISLGADIVIAGRSITQSRDIGAAVDLFLDRINNAL